jgi:integrase
MTSEMNRLEFAVNQLKDYSRLNHSAKTSYNYKCILNSLLAFAVNDERKAEAIIADYYEVLTHKPAYQHPDTVWHVGKVRPLFMLLDILNCKKIPRRYVYGTCEYTGTFIQELENYKSYLEECGNSENTVRPKLRVARKFCESLENHGIFTLDKITIDSILSFLQHNPSQTSNLKRHNANCLKNFLLSPQIANRISFNPIPLLSGFRNKKNECLKSFYSAEEVNAVMNAVDRTTKYGKAIYAMMLLACVYGLRVGDIRALQYSSLLWDTGKIVLFQGKTKRYVELPIIESVKFALLDYLKNARPNTDDPHIFIRQQRPHVPYLDNSSFSPQITKFFRQAGVSTEGKHHGFHSMRFSLATELLAEGIPLNEIANVLGHKSISPTKEYAWADIKHLKCAALEVPLIGY